jgi:hypothetical protein
VAPNGRAFSGEPMRAKRAARVRCNAMLGGGIILSATVYPVPIRLSKRLLPPTSYLRHSRATPADTRRSARAENADRAGLLPGTSRRPTAGRSAAPRASESSGPCQSAPEQERRRPSRTAP